MDDFLLWIAIVIQSILVLYTINRYYKDIGYILKQNEYILKLIAAHEKELEKLVLDKKIEEQKNE